MIYNTIMNSKQPLHNNNKRPKWNQELQQPFIENIDTSALETEMQSITNMTHIANITQNQMYSLSDLLSQTLINSADTTFQEPQRRIKSTNNAFKNHKCFGTDCPKTRKVYNKAKTKYNKYPTQHNKTVLQNASKAYKKVALDRNQ